MSAIQQLLTDHIDIWTAAETEKKSGRGRASGNAGSVYGIRKLRELILELAVRGKLVPQDAADEPASELLKRIQVEKAKQIAEGAVRKGQPLPSISEQEKSFHLPVGWGWVRLGQIGDWGAGATPLRSVSSYYGGETPWFKSGELTADFIDTSEETITELALRDCSLRLNQPGDVLIAMYGATIGKTAILKVPGTTNQAVCACTPNTGIFNRYLLTLLKATKSNFIGQGAGGAQPNISREKIILTVVAMPPTVEQHRIVEKVDELMALCDQLENQHSNAAEAHEKLVSQLLGTLLIPSQPPLLQRGGGEAGVDSNWQRIAAHFDTLFTTDVSIDALKQTLLQLAVMGKLVPQNANDEPASELLKRIQVEKAKLIAEGKIKKDKPLPLITDEEKPFELPCRWEWVRLFEVTTGMDSGWSPACLDNCSPSDNVWGVLKTTAVQVMEYFEYENKELPENLQPRPEAETKAGDILFTRAGPINRVAISCFVRVTRPKLMISDKIIRFHPVDIGVDGRFMTLCLNAGATADYLENAKSGMAASQVNISQEKLRLAPIPMPPLAEQHRIVAKVDELMTLCDQLKSRITDASRLQQKLADVLVEQAVA